MSEACWALVDARHKTTDCNRCLGPSVDWLVQDIKQQNVTGLCGLWCTIWIRHKTTEGNRCQGPVVYYLDKT